MKQRYYYNVEVICRCDKHVIASQGGYASPGTGLVVKKRYQKQHPKAIVKLAEQNG